MKDVNPELRHYTFDGHCKFEKQLESIDAYQRGDRAYERYEN